MEELKHYLTSTNPASGLRFANKQYTELNAALDQKLGALKLEVKGDYERVFEELRQEVKQRGVEVQLIDSESKLREIDSATSIGQLQQLKFGASGFREEELTKILNAASAVAGPDAPSRNETFTMRKHASSISSEAELDEYLTKTREDLKKLLDEGKTIILR